MKPLDYLTFREKEEFQSLITDMRSMITPKRLKTIELRLDNLLEIPILRYRTNIEEDRNFR